MSLSNSQKQEITDRNSKNNLQYQNWIQIHKLWRDTNEEITKAQVYHMGASKGQK